MQEGKILSLAYIYQKIKGEKNIHDGDVSNSDLRFWSANISI